MIGPHELRVDFTNPGNRLGRGGFGEVWKGRYHGETVAVKRLKRARDADDAATRRREKDFLREVAIHSRLRFPSVVSVYGACFKDGEWLLVMEYCQEGSLEDVLRDGKIELTDRLRLKISRAVAHGMAYLHNARVSVCVALVCRSGSVRPAWSLPVAVVHAVVDACSHVQYA